jgi:hypothetical protein
LADASRTIRERARIRGIPSLADAVAATGAVAVAIGVLLMAVDVHAAQSGVAAETAMFAGLVLAGYLVLIFAPAEVHAAGVTAIVLGIPGAMGWAFLPGAHSFGDVRPFLLLTIAGWALAFVAPRSTGRTIFVGAAALFLWLWLLGEVAGTGAFSAAPLPSPPAHTIFSLRSFVGGRATVDVSDLDPTNPLYPIAVRCSEGDESACDTLYRSAPEGSDFKQFGATCGNTIPNAENAGFCDLSQSFGSTPFNSTPSLNPITPFKAASDKKSTDIGIVSAFFGVLYLGALWLLDRNSWRGLATAFVVPGFVALLTGAQSLGDAANHAWVSGVLTFVAGLAFGFVGDVTQRRFTTWAGAIAAAYGAVVVALDAVHISHSVSNGNVKLAGPGLVVCLFGVMLVGLGYLIARLFAGHPGSGSASFELIPPSPGAPAAPPPPTDAPSWPTLPPDDLPSSWPPTSPPRS